MIVRVRSKLLSLWLAAATFAPSVPAFAQEAEQKPTVESKPAAASPVKPVRRRIERPQGTKVAPKPARVGSPEVEAAPVPSLAGGVPGPGPAAVAPATPTPAAGAAEPIVTPTPGTGAQGGPMQASGNPADEGELYRCKNLPKNAKFKVTLKPDSELKDLVNWAMSFTCRNFIFGQGIMGRAQKVTIIAPNEMSANEAWNLFLVALSTMNLNVVPKGRTLEIVESQTTREKPLPVYKGESVPNNDQIVRAIFRPENVTVDDAAQIINTVKSKDGMVTPLPNMGVLVVTDYGSHITKMSELLHTIDEPLEGEKIYIVPVKNADAVELGAKLNEIFGARQGGAPQAQPQARVPASSRGKPQAAASQDVTANVTPSKIITDERTNSLIVIASEPAYLRILALIKRLDEPGEGGQGTVHVLYLSNADAEEMSNTLSSVISGQGSTQGQTGNRVQRQQNTGGAPASPGQGAAFEGNIRVSFDKPTNSLVVVSSVKDFFALKEVVRKLDQPRNQVFVEAVILEVSLDCSRRLGVSFHGGLPVDIAGKEAVGIFGAQHGSDLASANPAGLGALTGGLGALIGEEIPNSTEVLGFALPSFGVLFQMLQNSNDVNVVSSPHILTTDNVPAEISIGQNIPIQSGSSLGALGGQAGAAAGLGLLGGANVQRQDVGLKLKITPHVNDSGMVRLELEQEINAIASENFGGLGASWTKRSVKTTVVVRDQQPVVIGGLMSDEQRVTESKVPLLGDIPILGYLFKFQRKVKQKTNLIIFLTPYVIQDQNDLRRIFDRKMRERREFLRSYSMFQDTQFEVDVDYGKKRGLVEDINHSVRAADEDAQALREAESRALRRDTEGPVEMPAGMNQPPASSGTGDQPQMIQPPPPPPRVIE